MKFWSDVEKEYNDLFGDEGESRQDEEGESKMESDFNSMFKDIKKDLNKFPKDDLLPGYSPKTEASDAEDEDGEFDEEDARKALKIGNVKKKRDKKCKFGDKTYEVGERWKDPKTGKDMICILMNIPKEVQPKLAEADLTITKEVKPESQEPDLKPKTSGPQWSYTNKQPKGKWCSSDKDSEMPDQVGSEAVENEAKSGQEENDVGNEGNPLGELTPSDKETENLEKDDTPGEHTREEAEHSKAENSEKASDENAEETPLKNGPTSERLEENSKNERDDTESESDTHSEEEKREAEKNARDAEDSEYEEKGEDNIKYQMDNKNSEINVAKEDVEPEVIQTDEPEKQTEITEQTNKAATDNSEAKPVEPANDTEEIPREKGKTIFTKETTVTQKKLFKTSETIESVETEKNID